MKEILFLDHRYHEFTRSSSFFKEILEKQFVVKTIYLNEDPREQLEEVANANFYAYILWQTEYLAPYLLAKGKRVLCIPMFDAVERSPNHYWKVMEQAVFLNFSAELHHRLTSLGIESHHFKYYIKPRDELNEGLKKENLAVFWQRIPEHGLDWRYAKKIAEHLKCKLHVHNVPDQADPMAFKPPSQLSVSLAGDTNSTYLEVVKRARYFIAPRYTEGIGIALLEAISYGCVPIVINRPTANEYVHAGLTGVVLDYPSLSIEQSGSEFDWLSDNYFSIQREMVREVADGYRNWLKESEKICQLVHTLPLPDYGINMQKFASRYLAISKYYFKYAPNFFWRLQRIMLSDLVYREYGASGIKERLKIRLLGRLSASRNLRIIYSRTRNLLAKILRGFN